MLQSFGRFIVALALVVAPASTRAQSEAPVDGGATAGQSPVRAPASTTDAPQGFVRTLAGDFGRVFARENAPVGVLFGAAALVSSPWDQRVAGTLRGQPSRVFRAGNIGGALVTQASGALATMVVGGLIHQPQTLEVGSELLRAQLVSQAFVQALKVSTSRARPDASNRFSLPSGHAATAFATATVLERRLGWKVGLPAYALASYVAASRIASRKHYLSDVLVGAAIGVASGRAATVGAGRARFDLGVAATPGGASVTFTKKP